MRAPPPVRRALLDPLESSLTFLVWADTVDPTLSQRPIHTNLHTLNLRTDSPRATYAI